MKFFVFAKFRFLKENDFPRFVIRCEVSSNKQSFFLLISMSYDVNIIMVLHVRYQISIEVSKPLTISTI